MLTLANASTAVIVLIIRMSQLVPDSSPITSLMYRFYVCNYQAYNVFRMHTTEQQ